MKIRLAYTFKQAINLNTIYLPKTIDSIMSDTFMSCVNDTTVYAYNGTYVASRSYPNVEVIERNFTENELNKRNELSNLIVEDISKYIPDGYRLTEPDEQGITYYIDINDTSYNAGVWSAETNNEEIEIPESFNINGIDIPVVVIKKWAFDKAPNLKKIYLPETVDLNLSYEYLDKNLTIYVYVVDASKIVLPETEVSVILNDNIYDTIQSNNSEEVDKNLGDKDSTSNTSSSNTSDTSNVATIITLLAVSMVTVKSIKKNK